MKHIERQLASKRTDRDFKYALMVKYLRKRNASVARKIERDHVQFPLNLGIMAIQAAFAFNDLQQIVKSAYVKHNQFPKGEVVKMNCKHI